MPVAVLLAALWVIELRLTAADAVVAPAD